MSGSLLRSCRVLSEPTLVQPWDLQEGVLPQLCVLPVALEEIRLRAQREDDPRLFLEALLGEAESAEQQMFHRGGDFLERGGRRGLAREHSALVKPT